RPPRAMPSSPRSFLSVQRQIELGTIRSEQGEHRRETEQLLDHVRLPEELALPVETAAFVLLSGAAGAGSVARNEADAGEPRSSSGRPVRSAPGAGADARTEERGAEMEAPPRRIGRNAGHRRRSPFGS